MSDEQIIKALVEIASGENKKCAFRYCNLVHEVLDLINRQKAEIEILIRKKETLRDELAEKDAEIERLQVEGLQINKTFMGFVNNQEYEAIKEFAKRLKESVINWDYDFLYSSDKNNALFDIDNLVKEMTEQKG